MRPFASGSLQPARKAWRVTHPGHASHGEVAHGEVTLNLQVFHFLLSQRSLVWGSHPSLPHLFRAPGEDGQSQQDFCSSPHHLRCPGLSHQPTECQEFHGFQAIVLGKAWPWECWQARVFQAFDNTGIPRGGQGPDGNSGLVTVTRVEGQIRVVGLEGEACLKYGRSRSESRAWNQRYREEGGGGALELQVAELLWRGQWEEGETGEKRQTVQQGRTLGPPTQGQGQWGPFTER